MNLRVQLPPCVSTNTNIAYNTNTSTIKNTRKGKKCVKMEIQTQVQIFIVMKFIRRTWLPCWLRFDLTNQKEIEAKRSWRSSSFEGLACPEDFRNLERRRIESKDLNAGYLRNVMPSSKGFLLNLFNDCFSTPLLTSLKSDSSLAAKCRKLRVRRNRKTHVGQKVVVLYYT